MAAAPVPLSGEIPDEDREIYQNLARLQKIHQQVFELRTLLPDKLVQPNQIGHGGQGGTRAPQRTASDIREAAIAGSQNIKSFQAEYESEEMKTLWDSVKATSVEPLQGHDMWTSDYNELVNPAKSISGVGSSLNRPGTTPKKPAVDSAGTDDREVLDTFSTLHPDVKATRVEEDHVLPLKVDTDGLSFLVKRTGSDECETLSILINDDKTALPELREALARISEEENLQRLGQALSLVASYKGYRSQRCHKCDKVFDANLQLAVYRRLKEASRAEALPVWTSLHHSCISNKVVP